MIHVHILREGLPLCGFTNVLPIAWPKTHKWVSIADATAIDHVTCAKCLRAKIYLLAGAEEHFPPPTVEMTEQLSDEEMTAMAAMVTALRRVTPARRLDLLAHFARLMVDRELAARFFPDAV